MERREIESKETIALASLSLKAKDAWTKMIQMGEGERWWRK